MGISLGLLLRPCGGSWWTEPARRVRKNTAEISDECGGLIDVDLQNCMAGVCIDECFPGTINMVSKVTRVDHDDSEGNGQILIPQVPKAPIRIVGAGTSTCAPYNPP